MHISKHAASTLLAPPDRSPKPRRRVDWAWSPAPARPPARSAQTSFPGVFPNLLPSPRPPPEALGRSETPEPQTQALAALGGVGWRGAQGPQGLSPRAAGCLPARPASGRPARSYGPSPAPRACALGGAGPPPCRTQSAGPERRAHLPGPGAGPGFGGARALLPAFEALVVRAFCPLILGQVCRTGVAGRDFSCPPNPCITVSRAEPGRGDRGARKDSLEGYRAEWLVTKDEAAPGHAPQPSVCSVQRLPTAPALPPGGGELRSVKKTASGRVKGTCDRREEPSCGGSGPGPAGHKEQH